MSLLPENMSEIDYGFIPDEAPKAYTALLNVQIIGTFISETLPLKNLKKIGLKCIIDLFF